MQPLRAEHPSNFSPFLLILLFPAPSPSDSLALCAETTGTSLPPLITPSPQREGEPLLLDDEERKKVVGVTGNGLVSSPRAEG